MAPLFFLFHPSKKEYLSASKRRESREKKPKKLRERRRRGIIYPVFTRSLDSGAVLNALCTLACPALNHPAKCRAVPLSPFLYSRKLKSQKCEAICPKSHNLLQITQTCKYWNQASYLFCVLAAFC